MYFYMHANKSAKIEHLNLFFILSVIIAGIAMRKKTSFLQQAFSVFKLAMLLNFIHFQW